MESGRYIMILANLKEATNINEYQTSLKQQLQKAHGEQYTDYLDEIYRLTKNSQSYREIGTYQGASTSTAMINNIPFVETIDLDFVHINPHKHIFETHAQQNNVEFKMIQSDSLKYNIDKTTEVLLIDGYHNPKHIAKELDKYAPWTTQTIILHDTTLFPRLWKSVQNFLSSHQDWKLVYRHTLNAGYTVLGKK